MGRYVDLNKVTVWRCPRNIAQMREWAFSLPVEDVKPITHAHWTGVTPMVDTIMCSNCGWNYPTNEFATPYCPSCGAKMDEDEEVSHD